MNVNRDQQVSIYQDLSTCPNSHVYRVRGFHSALRTRFVRHCRTIGKLVYSHLWLLFINSCERGSACIHYRDQSEFIWQVRTIVFILSKMCMYALSTSRSRDWQVKGCSMSVVGSPPHSLLFPVLDKYISRGEGREIEKTRTAQSRAADIDPYQWWSSSGWTSIAAN